MAVRALPSFSWTPERSGSPLHPTGRSGNLRSPRETGVTNSRRCGADRMARVVLFGSSRKWLANICARAQVHIEGHRTVAGRITVSPRHRNFVKTMGTMQMLDAPQVPDSAGRGATVQRSASAGTTGGGRYEKVAQNERPDVGAAEPQPQPPEGDDYVFRRYPF